MQERPNVIVIVSDTFRPDHIGYYGNGYADTPELDRFVERGVTFDHATTASFPTIPMRTDSFTGRFGHTRYGWKDLDRSAITLPAILREAGYTTQLIADTTHMLRAKFWEPFKHFHFLRGHEGDVPLSRLNDPVKRVISDRRKTRVEFGASRDDTAICDVHAHTNFRQRYEDEAQCALLADVACRWIEDNYRGRPFHLWLDFFDVHEPWFPPEYLVNKYHPGYAGDPMVHPNYWLADAYEPEELADLRARYASMCTLLSKHAGRVLRLVEDTGLSENSVVVLLSDHGTLLGEHGLTGKSYITPEMFDVSPFHPEISRIVCSLSVPESLSRTLTPGTQAHHLVQPPDLLPTVLDLCGIAPPAKAQIEGASLAPILRGETDDGLRDVAVTAWTTRNEWKCRRPGVTDGEWSLILGEPPDPKPPMLYHTAEDPMHERELLAEHPDEAKRLHAGMIAFLQEHEADADTLARLSKDSVGLG